MNRRAVHSAFIKALAQLCFPACRLSQTLSSRDLVLSFFPHWKSQLLKVGRRALLSLQSAGGASLVRVPEDWLVFPAPDGEMNVPRHPDSVTKQFTKRAEKILGFSIRLHDLRVSHGTWLLDQGRPVHTVAKRLGHDPSVLLKVYAKRTKKGDESAAETIGLMTKGLSI